MSLTHNLSATSTPSLGAAAADSQQQQQQQQQQRATSPGGGLVGPDPEALRNLIVNYLPPLMNEAQLCQLFGQFGNIESVKIIYDKITHESRGYGFVKFQFFFSATYAISCLNRYEIAGKKLKVAYANVEAAREAYEMLRISATAFNMQQQAALQQVYYAQMLAAEQENSGNGGNGW